MDLGRCLAVSLSRLAQRLLPALAVLLAVPSLSQAYSINTTESGRRIRWSRSEVTLHVEPSVLAMLPNDEVAQALRMAVDAWQGLPGTPLLSLSGARPPVPGNHKGGPSNGIYLPATWEHDPNKLAITVVTYEMASGRLLDADVLVNPEVPFGLLNEAVPGATSELDERRDPSVGQVRPFEAPPTATLAADRYDLGAVMAHEIGHVLGLGESEDDRMATMWPFANMGDTHQRTLSDDDEAGVIEAYGGPAPLPASACAPMSVGGTRGAPLWLAGVFFAVAALLLHRLVRSQAAGTPATRGARAGASPMIAAGFSVLLAGGGLHAGADQAHTGRIERVRTAVVGGGEQATLELRTAALDSDARVREVAAQLMGERCGSSQLELARRLASDESTSVARAGHTALARCAAAIPERVVSAGAPAAARLARLIATPETRGYVGRVERTGSFEHEGRIYTRFEITSSSGERRELRVLGGEHEGIGQRYGDDTLPTEGAEVMLGESQGRWAYHAVVRSTPNAAPKALVWGGSLGHEAAISLP